MGFNYAKFLPLLKCEGVDVKHFLYIVCLTCCASDLQHSHFGRFVSVIV